MKEESMGAVIASLRKQHGMTQLELAEQMGVTDKAVSKWERNLSCPDISSLPKLAELFGVSVDDLVGTKTEAEPQQAGSLNPTALIATICKAIALAMGVAVTVLSAMHKLEVQSGLSMLGIGLACIAISLFQSGDHEK